MSENYKDIHQKYHVAYKNEHWALKSKSAEEKKKAKQEAKAFKKETKMPRYPFMADFFDYFEEMRAYPNSITCYSADVKVDKDVVYKTIDGEELVLDVYYPPKPVSDKAPLVLDIPGGGWMIHNRPRRDGYARVFAAMGAVVAVIDHRLCPKVHFPENLHDCIDAYNFMVDNAEKYNIDPNNITVTGDSSGGHLTACLGCAASSKEYVEKLGLPSPKTKPVGLICISGAFSFETMYKIPFTHTLIVRHVTGLKSRRAFRKWEFYKETIPYNYVTPEYPETYNNGGGTDLFCFGTSKALSKKLDQAGVRNECRVRKSLWNSFHCYVLRFPYKSSRKDAILLYNWYYRKEKELGVDMTENYNDVEDFLKNYRKRIKEIH